MKKLSLVVALSAVLAACGGGGGSSEPVSEMFKQTPQAEAPKVDKPQVESPKPPESQAEPPKSQTEPHKAADVEPVPGGHIHTTPDEKIPDSWFAKQDAPTAKDLSDAYFVVNKWVMSDRAKPEEAETEAVGHLMYWHIVKKAMLESEARNTYASCKLLKEIEDQTFATMMSNSPKQFGEYMRNYMGLSKDIISNPQLHEDEVASHTRYATTCTQQ